MDDNGPHATNDSPTIGNVRNYRFSILQVMPVTTTYFVHNIKQHFSIIFHTPNVSPNVSPTCSCEIVLKPIAISYRKLTVQFHLHCILHLENVKFKKIKPRVMHNDRRAKLKTRLWKRVNWIPSTEHNFQLQM